ncbi:MAG: hypothetical protein RLZZ416_752 [Candidatus Parcubacteria bacterium]|jgi:hypothetical protein
MSNALSSDERRLAGSDQSVTDAPAQSASESYTVRPWRLHDRYPEKPTEGTSRFRLPGEPLVTAEGHTIGYGWTTFKGRGTVWW